MKARDNPFASHRIEALPFLFPDGDTWEEFLERLRRNQWRGAIVGPHGSGKTTLLEQLVPVIAKLGCHPRFVSVRAEHSAFEKTRLIRESANLKPADFLLLDGAEQISLSEWKAITGVIAGCAGCVVTSHREGYLPPIIQTRPTSELLVELIWRLCSVKISKSEASILFNSHKGNIRECFRQLYDNPAGIRSG